MAFRPWVRRFATTTRTRNRAQGAVSYVRSVRSQNIQFSEALEECLMNVEYVHCHDMPREKTVNFDCLYVTKSASYFKAKYLLRIFFFSPFAGRTCQSFREEGKSSKSANFSGARLQETQKHNSHIANPLFGLQGWPAIVTRAQDFPFASALCASSAVQLMPLRETQSHFIQLNIARIDAAIHVRSRLLH